jgi:Tol biopolymer transport system component
VSDRAWKEPASLVLLSIESGERRRLTTPAASSAGDFYPAVSPDGRKLAFVRDGLMVATLTKTFALAGEPRLVSKEGPASIRAVKWTPDGRDLVYAASTTGPEFAIWRVPANAATPPRRLDYTGLAGRSLAVSPASTNGTTRLAYARETLDYDIWRTRIGAPDGNAELPFKWIESTRTDANPEYSPDGQKILFTSARLGDSDVWISAADGSDPVRLTSMGQGAGSPRWSPDGEWIAFDSKAEGQWEVYVVRAGGGTPRRITNHPGFDAVPSWSRDGKWIYFSSDRTGEHQVWKTSAGGGDPKQVTNGGGSLAFESVDLKLLYYMKTNRDCAALWSVPPDGGEEKEILPQVCWRGFLPSRDGLFFMQPYRREGLTRIHFYSFASGETRTVAAFKGEPGNGLSVSPDGQFVLYVQREQRSDLMLIENFR